MLSITCIPIEVINTHLVPYLTTDAIVVLGYTMNIDITEQTYHRCFPESTHFDHYDFQLFEERASAELWVVGRSPQGVIPSASPLSHYIEHLPFDTSTLVHTPLRLTFPRPIRNPVFQRDKLCVLDTSGDVYVQQHAFLEGYRHEFGGFKQWWPEECRRLPGFNAAKLPFKFLEMARRINRTQVPIIPDQSDAGITKWQRSDSGYVWTWKLELGAYPLLFWDNVTKDVATETCLQVEDGVFLLQGRGVFMPDNRTCQEYCAPENVKFDVAGVVSGKTVPQSSGARHMVALVESVFWLDRAGLLGGEFREPYYQSAPRQIDVTKANKLGPFCQMYENHNNLLYLVTIDGHVAIVEHDGNSRLLEEEEDGLAWTNVRSLAFGDNHVIILSRDGTVSTQGANLSFSAVVGLLTPYGERHVGPPRTPYQDKPEKVKFSTKAVAVFADGNLSWVLCEHDKSEQIERARKRRRIEAARKSEQLLHQPDWEIVG